MLEEFCNEVKSDLGEKIETELRKLVSVDGSERHDFIRGSYHGLTVALTIVNEAIERYSDDKTVDLAEVRDQQQAAGRNYSRGARQ